MPIPYESRVAKLSLNAAELPRLDAEFEEINLRAWLEPYGGRTGAIFALAPRKRMAALSKAAGGPWKRNALRHGFGSYRMEATKNAGHVSLEMGNSAAVVLSHYFEIVDARAAAYWSLRPVGPASNVWFPLAERSRRRPGRAACGSGRLKQIAP